MATLLRADRPSTRAAASSASPTLGTRDPSDPSALTEAVFRALAPGRCTVDEIARCIGATPAAIADEIERLRNCGMAIGEQGGTLIATPIVPLDRSALTRALAADGPCDGTSWNAEVVFATGSTNADLLAAVRAGATGVPTVLAAELQHAGRGRLGRRWSSVPGASLTASFALTVRRRMSELDGATLVCGLAVHAVLANMGVDARLKWPNDLLVDGAKVAGILVEAHAARESSVLVVGIGVNVAGEAGDAPSPDPSGLRRTTLAAATAAAGAGVGPGDVDRNVLAARLARSLEAHLDAFETGGFAGFVGRWNAVDAFADRRVTLDAAVGARRAGVARGVDGSGALLVDIDGERHRIVAGDLSLRPADGVSA